MAGHLLLLARGQFFGLFLRPRACWMLTLAGWVGILSTLLQTPCIYFFYSHKDSCDGERDIVSLQFHLCTLIPITSILELSSVMCLALLSVEEPDGEKDLNMLKHSGPLLPFLSVTMTKRRHRFLVTICSFFIFLLCQGERGLDGFPGKPGETGEQVGGSWAMILGTGMSEPLCKPQLLSCLLGATVV